MGTRGFKKFRAKLRNADRKLSKAPRKITSGAGRRGVTAIKRQIIQNDAVASTELFRSVNYSRVDKNTVHLNVDAGHAGYVEHGTGQKGDGTYPAPDFVYWEVIFEWMLQKPTFAGEITPQTALFIANSIEETGQRQQPFFDEGMKIARGHFLNKGRRELKNALN